MSTPGAEATPLEMALRPLSQIANVASLASGPKDPVRPGPSRSERPPVISSAIGAGMTLISSGSSSRGDTDAAGFRGREVNFSEEIQERFTSRHDLRYECCRILTMR
jgi:hypothetical protein